MRTILKYTRGIEPYAEFCPYPLPPNGQTETATFTQEQLEKAKQETRHWEEKTTATERSDEFTEAARHAYIEGVKLRFFMQGLGELKNEADKGITLDDYLKAQMELVNALVAAGKSPQEIEKFLELFRRHALLATRSKTPNVVASGVQV